MTTKIDDLLGPNGFIERKGNAAVLLVHGLTGTPAEMKHFGRLMSRKGLTIVCPELAGHCKSIEALQATKWQDWYQSIETAFDALRTEYEHVFIAGLSMGALIALLVAAKRKSQVAGVILLSTTFFYDGWNVSKFKQKYILPIVLYSPLKYFLSWEETAPYGIKCERTRAMVAAVLENKGLNGASDETGYFKTPATVILESFGLIKAAQKSLGDVAVPALIVHSTEDDMASLENAYYVEKNIASKHVETMYIDDTYHVVTLDKRKDDIALRVVGFCNALADIITPKTQTKLA